MKQKKYFNDLAQVRRERGLSRKQVTKLLGKRAVSTIQRYERGVALPSLITALRMEILYRTPVAFLYRRTYIDLRESLRREEERITNHGRGEEAHG